VTWVSSSVSPSRSSEERGRMDCRIEVYLEEVVVRRVEREEVAVVR